MSKRIKLWLLLLTFFALCPVVLAQGKAQRSQKAQAQTAQPQMTETQRLNIEEYVELLRSNVRQEKAQLLGAVLQLNVDDAEKFWPLYSEYDAELTKINNRRADNIQEFTRNYSQMTDEKADEIVRSALDSMKQRAELLLTYYERLKEPLGSINAARFLQIENQLLLIIDLQIFSSLPIFGEEMTTRR
jgi:hypothetical protein